jgi:hypothetical protein
MHILIDGIPEDDEGSIVSLSTQGVFLQVEDEQDGLTIHIHTKKIQIETFVSMQGYTESRHYPAGIFFENGKPVESLHDPDYGEIFADMDECIPLSSSAIEEPALSLAAEAGL